MFIFLFFKNEIAKEEIEPISNDCIARLSVAFFPNLGYLIAVHEEDILQPLEVVEKDCKLLFQFQIDDVRYFKNPRMKELDLQLGDIPEQISDIERRILAEVEQTIEQSSNLILLAVDIIAEVDCYLSLALAVHEYHLVRPVLVDRPEISIVKGRNLLHELLVPSFVANDTKLKGDNPTSIVLITGPNASGKSVYLRQVAQIVFLAHIGSFVPAQSATIGLVDHILCRLITTESVSTPLSSFMIDSMQVSAMLRYSTSRSLLLIDEYGKGTNAEDGLSLLASVIHYFASLKEKCPMTLISTHFHQLFKQNLLPDTPLLMAATMEFHLKNQNTSISHVKAAVGIPSIFFTYKLIPGIATQSYSLYCARIAGIPTHVIQRAKEITEKKLSGTLNPINISSSSISEFNENQNEHQQQILSAFSLLESFDPTSDDITDFMKRLNSI